MSDPTAHVRSMAVGRQLGQGTMLALAALLDIADEAGDQPYARPLQLRALLTLLYGRSDRVAEPYAAFFETMTQEMRDTQAAYVRATYARTHWSGIVRGLGGSPEPVRFEDAIRTIVRAHAG